VVNRQAYPIPAPKEAAPLDPKSEARAKRLIQKGRVLYAKGEYEKAEEVLKEAVTLYPFLAEANLALGKIFLIRGSALRDRAMINSARLMFEMARALDPGMREPAVLLELFLAAPPE
jgi:tetratricopeptide (TPR) repeat protein